MFDLIVQLNYNRILGRLGSLHFQRGKSRTKNVKLAHRLRELFNMYLKVGGSKTTNSNIDLLDRQLRGFEQSFKRLESAGSTNLVPVIKDVVQHAFELTEDGVSLPARLTRLGCTKALLDTRTVRDVGKVSNYRRISRFLAVCSQRFASLFSSAEWQPLHNYLPSRKSQTIPRQFVHAEIQILAHYELNTPPLALPPRAIGVSKEACFLCDAFIRADGRFSITGAHRQVYSQWTVPDLKGYTPDTVQRLRRALILTAAKLHGEFVRSQGKMPHRDVPAQSAINLRPAQVRTPSEVSVALSAEGGVGRVKGSAKVFRPSRLAIVETGAVDPPEAGGAEGIDGPVVAVQNPPSDQKDRVVEIETGRGDVESPVDITASNESVDCRKWLRIAAVFAKDSSVDPASVQQSVYFGGSISLETVQEGECKKVLALSDIPTEEGVLLERGADDAADELSFVLHGSGDRRVRVCCQWHKPALQTGENA